MIVIARNIRISDGARPCATAFSRIVPTAFLTAALLPVAMNTHSECFPAKSLPAADERARDPVRGERAEADREPTDDDRRDREPGAVGGDARVRKLDDQRPVRGRARHGDRNHGGDPIVFESNLSPIPIMRWTLSETPPKIRHGGPSKL